MRVHPDQALYSGEKPFPVIPVCEHFAGSERLILKALALQDSIGPLFDVSCDCEDGAASGQEKTHAKMIVRILNSEANHYKMAGARIHDYSHPHWKQDVDILVGGAGNIISYLTLPKCTGLAQAQDMIAYIQHVAQQHGITRQIPLHLLIETHGALRQVHEIAQLPWLRVLDFGLMDFVSAHHGAIPASAMRSPGQFEHPLLARAKTEIVAAALANGLVPAHNVTVDLKNPEVTFSDASRARNAFGFMRMWSIHPTQIQPIIEAMQPNFEAVNDAANILLAAQAADWGPIQYAGELYDRASYRFYWDRLQKARQTGVRIPEAAEEAFFNYPSRF